MHIQTLKQNNHRKQLYFRKIILGIKNSTLNGQKIYNALKRNKNNSH